MPNTFLAQGISGKPFKLQLRMHYSEGGHKGQVSFEVSFLFYSHLRKLRGKKGQVSFEVPAVSSPANTFAGNSDRYLLLLNRSHFLLSRSLHQPTPLRAAATGQSSQRRRKVFLYREVVKKLFSTNVKGTFIRMSEFYSCCIEVSRPGE